MVVVVSGAFYAVIVAFYSGLISQQFREIHAQMNSDVRAPLRRPFSVSFPRRNKPRKMASKVAAISSATDVAIVN